MGSLIFTLSKYFYVAARLKNAFVASVELRTGDGLAGSMFERRHQDCMLQEPQELYSNDITTSNDDAGNTSWNMRRSKMITPEISSCERSDGTAYEDRCSWSQPLTRHRQVLGTQQEPSARGFRDRSRDRGGRYSYRRRNVCGHVPACVSS